VANGAADTCEFTPAGGIRFSGGADTGQSSSFLTPPDSTCLGAVFVVGDVAVGPATAAIITCTHSYHVRARAEGAFAAVGRRPLTPNVLLSGAPPNHGMELGGTSVSEGVDMTAHALDGRKTDRATPVSVLGRPGGATEINSNRRSTDV
jgi:hypothetical protein